MNKIFCIGRRPIWILLRYKIENFALGIAIDWEEGINILFRVGPLFFDIVIGDRPGMADISYGEHW